MILFATPFPSIVTVPAASPNLVLGNDALSALASAP
jgi:hypothetical protein